MITMTGTPRMSAVKASRKPSTPTTWVRRSEMISARPRALASIASVAMNGTIPP